MPSTKMPLVRATVWKNRTRQDDTPKEKEREDRSTALQSKTMRAKGERYDGEYAAPHEIRVGTRKHTGVRTERIPVKGQRYKGKAKKGSNW